MGASAHRTRLRQSSPRGAPEHRLLPPRDLGVPWSSTRRLFRRPCQRPTLESQPAAALGWHSPARARRGNTILPCMLPTVFNSILSPAILFGHFSPSARKSRTQPRLSRGSSIVSGAPNFSHQQNHDRYQDWGSKPRVYDGVISDQSQPDNRQSRQNKKCHLRIIPTQPPLCLNRVLRRWDCVKSFNVTEERKWH